MSKGLPLLLETYSSSFKIPVTLKKAITNLKVMAFDFDGIFTTNAVLVTDQGNELVQCSRFDGMGISAIKKLEIYPVVISAEKNVVVKHRCEKIKIDCFHGVDDKIGLLQEICKKRKVKASEVFYMGNDINDLACLNFAEISVTVPDAHPYVFSHARYMTSTVGGHGAVREMCDIIGRVRKA